MLWIYISVLLILEPTGYRTEVSTTGGREGFDLVIRHSGSLVSLASPPEIHSKNATLRVNRYGAAAKFVADTMVVIPVATFRADPQCNCT
jgi:hypothetical protein